MYGSMNGRNSFTEVIAIKLKWKQQCSLFLYLSFAVKPQYFMTDARCSACLYLMQMAEQIQPSLAPAIVQLALG